MSTYKTKVLVVDDIPDFVDMLAKILESNNYEVHTASNGRKALEIFKSINIDIILSDLRVPEGDGFELLKKLRELNPSLPIVILVTGDPEVSNQDLLNLGAHSVFTKPFKSKDLLAAIQIAIKNKT